LNLKGWPNHRLFHSDNEEINWHSRNKNHIQIKYAEHTYLKHVSLKAKKNETKRSDAKRSKPHRTESKEKRPYKCKRYCIYKLQVFNPYLNACAWVMTRRTFIYRGRWHFSIPAVPACLVETAGRPVPVPIVWD